MSTTVKPLYGSSVALTSTNLQSLASSSSLLGAWSSAVVDNTSNLSDDEVVTWIIKAGTSPSAAVVECWLWEIMDDAPTYPDTITGSEGTFTWTSVNVKQSGAFKPAGQIATDTTSNRLYYNTYRLSQAFGIGIPKKWGCAVTQSTGVALASSGNVITRIPVQYQLV